MNINFFKSDKSGGSLYNRIVEAIVYLTVLLVPIFYLPLTSGIVEYNKQMLLVVMASVGLIVWLLGVVVSGKLTIRTTPVDKGVLAVLVATLVATIFSLTPAKSIFGLTGSLSGAFSSVMALSVLYFLAVNTIHDRGRMLRNIMGLSIALVLGVGLAQMFGFYVLPGSFTHARSFSPVGSLNALGVIAAIALPLFAKTGTKGGSRFNMILGAVGTVLSIAVLGILNWWVVWAIALAGILAMIGFDSLNATRLAEEYSARSKRWPLSRFMVPMAFVVLGAFLLLIHFNLTSVKSHFPVEVAPSYSLSLGVTKSAMSERPIYGYGPENFSLAFDKFGASHLADTQLANMRFYDGIAEIFNVAVNGGILALVALGVLLWCLVQAMVRFGGAISEVVTKGQGTSWVSEASGTLAMTLGLVATLFLYPLNLTLATMWYTALMLAGLIVAGEGSVVVDIEERPMYSLSASLGFILGLILVLTGVYFSSVRYLADVKYGQAIAMTDPALALTSVTGAINLDMTNDRYLRDASQLALIVLQKEGSKPAQAGDTQRSARIQNLITSAVQLAQRATQVQPQESLNWNNLGVVYQALSGVVNNVEQLAQDAYAKAGSLRPGDPTFDNQIGQMWLARADVVTAADQRQDALTRAETAFKRAIDASSNYGLAIYNLGAVYEREGKVADAIKQLERIAPYNADNATLIFQLGMLYIRGGRKDDALAALQRAVLVAPQYANARWYLALLLEERGDIPNALAQMQEIEKSNPDNQILQDKIAKLEAGQRSIPPAKVIDSKPIQ